MAESLKQLKEENERLHQKLHNMEEMNKEYEDKLSTIPVFQDKIRVLEKMINSVNPLSSQFLMSKDSKSTKNTLNSQFNTRDMQSLKKLNLEVDYNKSAHLKTDVYFSKSLTSNRNRLAGHSMLNINNSMLPLLKAQLEGLPLSLTRKPKILHRTT